MIICGWLSFCFLFFHVSVFAVAVVCVAELLVVTGLVGFLSTTCVHRVDDVVAALLGRRLACASLVGWSVSFLVCLALPWCTFALPLTESVNRTGRIQELGSPHHRPLYCE